MSLYRHWDALGSSLRHLATHPVGSLMTLSVLAIALALPAGLYVLLHNAGNLLSAWEEQAQVSLFLKDEVSTAEAQALRAEIARLPGIREVKYVDKEAARQEFKQLSGFGDALDALEDNPLPASLVVGIDPTHYHPQQIQALVQRWSEDPRVDTAQYDLDWVARLQAMLDLAERAVSILAVLLAVGVVLIVGNTIRLNIMNRREEIAVAKLVGASNSFVRLPFLYHGFIQGALAGALAWATVVIGIALLQDPTAHLANLYGAIFRLRYLSPEQGGALVLGGALLGWLGSALAAQRHLRAIQ